MADVYARIAELGVVPVVAIDDADKALPLADALIAGGLPLAEITFRTAAARSAIEHIARERPGCLVGAGTILTVDQLRAAHDAGAAFGVAPGLNPKVAAEAARLGMPFCPGVMTPSDIEEGLDLGLKVLKFFPAEAAGGLKMLQALAGPYKHTGVKFIPTGGISPANLADYLAADVVLAVGGTWLAKKEDIAADRWETIQTNCRRVGELRKR